AEEPESPKLATYQYLGVTSDNDCGEDQTVAPNQPPHADCQGEFQYWGIDKLRPSSDKTCPIYMEDLDVGGTLDLRDDASVAFVTAGTIVDKDYKPYVNNIVVFDAWGCTDVNNDAGEGLDWVSGTKTNIDTNYISMIENALQDYHDGMRCHIKNVKTETGLYYICAPDNKWILCNEDAEGFTIWGERNLNFLYECKFNKGQTPEYQWEKVDSDDDRDGYTKGDGDCQDDPTLDPEGLDCPEIKEKDYVGLSLEDLRAKVKSECSYPQDSRCAICINLGAPEVCGDGLNNDCQADEEEFLPDQLNTLSGWTDDDCNKNEEACTQGFGSLSVQEQQKQQEKSIGTCSESGDPCQQDASECPDPDAEKCVFPPVEEPKEGEGGTGAKNIFDTSFSWIQTKENSNEGYCCGFRGVEDLGVIKTQIISEGGGDFACLTQDENLVGMEGFWDKLVPGETRCGYDWCWVNSIGNAKFKILTVKKPGQTPFDIVSNNYIWNVCNGTVFDKLPEPQSSSEDVESFDILKQNSNRFYCYYEGNHWALAECAGKDDARENEAIKGRFAGEGLFTLPLRKGDTKEIKNELIGQNIPIHSSLYKNFYGGNHYLDFTGYQYLNFMVKFVVDEEGTQLAEDKITLPAGIRLEIKGPGDTTLYSNNVLGYVVNGPLFKKDTYMHIKVPISEFKAVKSITIKAGLSDLKQDFLAVRNVYLSSDQDNSLCSGQDATQESSWLTNMDTSGVDKQITGEELCTELYGENAWLGRYDDDVTDPSASCCGNNLKEYYSESSKKVVTETQEDPEGPIKAKEDQYA
ncbi:MAG: hypothetical protein KJ922_05745, partial [Nanoarchaeota archaeon]|nr:hypothetical protein [Nanoarchaeota archaeon]